jgi:threonine/homoserine/homoserine lactone efflux protein
MDILLLQTIQWWIIGFSGAAMPGPVTALIVTETTKRGFIAGPLITLGHVSLEIIMVAALYVGLSDMLNQNRVTGGIGIVGGIVLMWLGIDMVTNAWRNRISLKLSRRLGTESGSASRHPFLGGIITTLVNPYWFLWWATVGATFLIQFRAYPMIGVLAFYFGHTLADWTWNNFVAFVVASGRRLVSDRLYRGILIACGLFMIGMSVYFLISGIEFIRAG